MKIIFLIILFTLVSFKTFAYECDGSELQKTVMPATAPSSFVKLQESLGRFCDVRLDDNEYEFMKDILKRSNWNPVYTGNAPGKLVRQVTTGQFRNTYNAQTGIKPTLTVTYTLYVKRAKTQFIAWKKSFTVSGPGSLEELERKAQSKAEFWLRLGKITRCD